jgi:hypothetical protein
MIKAISYCTDAVVLHGNRVLDQNIAKNYPGALWVSILAQIAYEAGIEVVTGDVAISNISANKWEPSEILVIQEQSALQAVELLSLGAVPLVLVCAESPLYIPKFYASLPRISTPFKNRILFRGAFSQTSLMGENHVLYFPSFSREQEISTIPWNKRKFLVMVAANKYWKIKRSAPRKLMAWARDYILGRDAQIPPETIKLQLHDKRLALVEYFGRSGKLDLFGTNWENINNLPEKWRGLEEVIEKLKPTPCIDKQQIISRYKYAICLENIAYPGYVTEKIIDCFRGGVIPIYLGAPDISDFVPKEAFIDLREFVNLDELNSYLAHITESQALIMVNAARAYLKGEIGLKYSYENWAHNVMNLVREHI